ncbi:hypothetical protein EV361DRAFT_956307 [Lentinula raphanica]|nr:hypothetical protein EV361DRAFT_956307 [Lentinula raphanica]
MTRRYLISFGTVLPLLYRHESASSIRNRLDYGAEALFLVSHLFLQFLTAAPWSSLSSHGFPCFLSQSWSPLLAFALVSLPLRGMVGFMRLRFFAYSNPCIP